LWTFLFSIVGSAIPAPKAPPRRTKQAKRALYLSSPIGLGHGTPRYRHHARELRQIPPRLEVDWLAQGIRDAPLEGER